MCTGIFDRCTAFSGRCKRQAAASCGAGTNCIWGVCMCILVSACGLEGRFTNWRQSWVQCVWVAGARRGSCITLVM
jgi:hypothetical protein